MSEAFERGFRQAAKPNFTVNEVIEAVELAFGDMRAEFATEIAALKSEIERLKQQVGGGAK
ncbi:hypothetical protein GOD34_18380 [Sinorhizobium medicae]|uniref:hypothetical protein n=1 Tax=Sinorhizobium medicae TaxID=110321 RepID=UPI000FD81AE4|nr:hypothetical protein [Sinorhizobium medicae]MDX0438928.1 hypothetical protein [Sinorhizobium medicae]MDX0652734.1 hypothetical protein [Sinorhizobium medicae]MDX1156592.1 hypothetical protein [Sinorhizobium medicae]RVJ03265.1 hypothetical protein CN181_25430 [Sinorhizobium medicae]